MALNETLKKKRELFFNNLLLLGFDTQSMETQYRIKFHKDMFSKTNKKGFEVITHFLFSKLSESTKQDYSIIWPLLDKEIERRFQKTTSAYLTSIAQNTDIRFPVVLHSVVTSYSGNRFYDLYFAFSCYVVKQAVLATEMFKPSNEFYCPGKQTVGKDEEGLPHGSKLLLNRPTLKNETFVDTVKTFQICTCNHFEEFKNVQKNHYKAFVSWQIQARELTKVVRNLKSSLSSSQELLDEKSKVLASLLHKDISEKDYMKEIVSELLDYKNKVECDWKVLEDFISKEQELWNKVESELDESEKPVLDGLEIEIKLPKFILEEMSVSEKEIYSSLKKQRKVSIIGSVQICIILLKYFSRIVKEGDFSKIKGVSIDDVTVMEECMTDLKSLNAKLCSEVLPSTIRHVEKLQESLGTANASGEFANFSQEFMSQAKVTNSECINKESVLNVTERLIKAPEKELTKCDTFLNESVDEKEFMLRLPKSEEQFPFNVLPPQITSSVSGIESTNNYLFKKIAETSVFSPTSTFSPTSIFSPASALPGVEINEEVSSSSEKTDCSLNLAVPFSPLISDGRKSHLAAEGCKMNESGLSEDLNSMTLPNVSLLD